LPREFLIIKSGEIIVNETLENLVKEFGTNLEDIFLRLHSVKEN